jgi:hypothetical protein
VKAARALNLAAFSNRDPAKIDRTTVRWDPRMVSGILSSLWQTRSGLAMRYDVYTHRMIQTLRRHFDRRGYTLRAQTELKSGTVVVWITVKLRGNRPGRGA